MQSTVPGSTQRHCAGVLHHRHQQRGSHRSRRPAAKNVLLNGLQRPRQMRRKKCKDFSHCGMLSGFHARKKKTCAGDAFRWGDLVELRNESAKIHLQRYFYRRGLQIMRSISAAAVFKFGVIGRFPRCFNLEEIWTCEAPRACIGTRLSCVVEARKRREAPEFAPAINARFQNK